MSVSFTTAAIFLEQPSFELQDIYRALNVLAAENDLIQSGSIRTACLNCYLREDSHCLD